MNDREFDALIRARVGAEVFAVPEKTRVRLDLTITNAPRPNFKWRNARILLVAAILAIMLVGIAYAAARGGYLRSLFASGESDIDPASVVDVGATGGTEEFSFAIDEAYWEGDRLWLSYTLRVPGDGVRLVAFNVPTMDGEPMNHSVGLFVEDAILWVVEDGVNEMTGVLELYTEADEEMHEIGATAWLMEPIAQPRGVALEDYLTLREAGAFDKGDFLYYVTGEDQGNFGGGHISLFTTAQVLEYMFGDENLPDETRTPSVEMMKELGYAEAVDSAEVRFDIEGSSQVACPVTGVAEEEIDMGDYTIRVPEFTMTHFGMNVLIRVYTDEREGLLVGRKFDIQTEEGTSLVDYFSCFSMEGGTSQDEEGRICVEYLYDVRGFLGEIPARVVLVPYKRDEKGVRVLDMERAVTLTLVAEEGEVPLEGMAYVTEGGEYYHCDRSCTGMISAILVSIEDAEARGQKPCPVCMGD